MGWDGDAGGQEAILETFQGVCDKPGPPALPPKRGMQNRARLGHQPVCAERWVPVCLESWLALLLLGRGRGLVFVGDLGCCFV